MSQTRTRPIRFLIGSLALVAVAGCTDSSGPGEPEDPGVLLVPAASGGFLSQDLVWTRDGTELVYVVASVGPTSGTVLKAVNVATHTVRQIEASPLILSVARGSSGDRIYFGTYVASGSGSGLFRVSRVHPTSGAVEIVTTQSLGSYNWLLVSADERFLVADRSLYDLQTSARIDLPPGRPHGFSPDGTQLLYELNVAGSSNTSPTLISTADGSSQPLQSPGYFIVAHRWEGNSPRLLKAVTQPTGGNNSTIQLSEIDGLTGASRDLAQFSTTSYFYGFNSSWSPDGQTLGVWIDEGSLGDRTRRTNLYVIRSAGAAARVASVSSIVLPGRPVFSPNGSSIAYFYNHEDDRRSLYLKSGI